MSQRRFILGVIDGGIGGWIDDGIRVRRPDRGVELPDERLRRAGLGEDALPERQREPFEALGLALSQSLGSCQSEFLILSPQNERGRGLRRRQLRRLWGMQDCREANEGLSKVLTTGYLSASLADARVGL